MGKTAERSMRTVSLLPHGDFDRSLEAGSSSSWVGWRKFRCFNEGINRLIGDVVVVSYCGGGWRKA